MSEIEITAGSRQGQYWEPDGVFPAMLVGIEVKGKGGLKSDGFPGFPNQEVGKPDYYIREWCFEIIGAPEGANLVWASSSESATPRSKGYAYIAALLGGNNKPAVGVKFEVERQLVGRTALVTVRRDDQGYVKVEQVTAMPAAMLSQQVAQMTGAPVRAPAPAAPPAAPVAPTSSILSTVQIQALRDQLAAAEAGAVNDPATDVPF